LLFIKDIKEEVRSSGMQINIILSAYFNINFYFSLSI